MWLKLSPIWIAVLVDDEVTIRELPHNGMISFASTNHQLAVMFTGCYFVRALIPSTDRHQREDKSLLRFQNNVVGPFRVRTYRERVTEAVARADFSRIPDVNRPQGMND